MTPVAVSTTSATAHAAVAASSRSQRAFSSPCGMRRRKCGLIDSAEYRATTAARSLGDSADTGASTPKRISSPTGASAETRMNTGSVHGFISASGRYSGSSDVP